MEPCEVSFDAPDGTEVVVTLCDDRKTVLIDGNGNDEVEYTNKDGSDFPQERFDVLVDALKRGLITFEKLSWAADEETKFNFTPEEWERYRSAV